MKKTTLLLILGLFIYAQTSFAQDAGQIRGKAGFALGTESGINDSGGTLGFGIVVGADYFFTDKIAAAVSYTFFFPSTVDLGGSELKASASTLDFDGKYYFLNEGVNVYGLFGLSIGFAKASVSGFGSASESEFGVNVGGGLDYYLSDKLFLTAQLKYNSPLAQLGVDAGVGFNIN